MCEPPQNYNSTYSCWSYSLLHRVIKSVYGKEISFSCVYSNLKKLGTKLIKPTKVLAKASQEKIDQYNAELKSLHDKFNDETDVLYYHDECGINLDPKKYGKVLTFKGMKPTIISDSKYGRINLSGFVNPKTNTIDILRIPYGNSESLILHLDLMVQKHKEKENIYLIMDNAKWHKSTEVKTWLIFNPKVKILFLPPYCPNMNVVERFWWFLKTNIIRNECFSTHYECLARVFNFFKELSLDKKQIQRLCCIKN